MTAPTILHGGMPPRPPPRLIVLASGSAGRRQLLRSAGAPFVVAPSGVEEPPPTAADAARPHEYTLRLARAKAHAVAGRLPAETIPAGCGTAAPVRAAHVPAAQIPAAQIPPTQIPPAQIPATGPPLVLGCDTCIALDGAILGKPRDVRQADDFLRLLAGREHRVVTGVCVIDAATGAARQTSVESAVRLRALSPAERQAYLRTGEWRGAAGGYRAQGRGARLVERIGGSRSNVVGLPLEALYGILEEIDTSRYRKQPRGTTWR